MRVRLRRAVLTLLAVAAGVAAVAIPTAAAQAVNGGNWGDTVVPVGTPSPTN